VPVEPRFRPLLKILHHRPHKGTTRDGPFRRTGYWEEQIYDTTDLFGPAFMELSVALSYYSNRICDVIQESSAGVRLSRSSKRFYRPSYASSAYIHLPKNYRREVIDGFITDCYLIVGMVVEEAVQADTCTFHA